MRVRMVRARREHDEQGAVVVLVALLTVVLLVVAAMVVDFGQAYVNKRQAQTAADAGAIAAAKVYADAKATCPSPDGSPVIPTGGTLGNATAAAEEMRLANMKEPEKGSGVLDPVMCEDGAIVARYHVQTDSPVGLGQLAGSSDTLTVARDAAASYGVSQKGVGSLRPWMICGAYIPDPPAFPSKVIAVGMPGNGHLPSDLDANCENPNDPGVWWRTQCFNEGGAHGDMLTNIRKGCDTVEIVPNQDPTDTPAERTLQLQGECLVESEYCMADDSGRDSNSPGALTAWKELVGETVAMPVFCVKPKCDPTSVDPDEEVWPVWKIAAVTICGVSINRRPSTLSSDPLCQSGNNPDGHNLTTTFSGHGDMGFLVVFRGLIEAGGAGAFTVDVETTMKLVE